MRIYPNPARDLLHIDVSEIPNYEVNLYSAEGKLLLQTTNQSSIQVGNFVEGLYLVQVKDLDSNRTSTERIIIGRE